MPPTSGALPGKVYIAYGLGVTASHDFPELPITQIPVDYHIEWDCEVPVPHGARWSVLWRLPSGEPWALVARANGAQYVFFPRYMTFCARDGCLYVARRGHATDATLRHLLLDQALPLVLAAQGHLVVHASAVLLEGRATLLVGEAGAGKSTLAAALGAQGGIVLADDGVLIRESPAGLDVIPSYAGSRLHADSAAAVGAVGAETGSIAEYSVKRRFAPPPDPPSPRGPFALGPVYIIEAAGEGTDLHIAPLSRRDATVALLHHAYRADLADRSALRAQFDTLSEWSSRLGAWRVSVPRQLDQVTAVAAALAAHARGPLPGEPPGF
jgi:hypothetical protein